MENTKIIKRYQNRKLYDTSASSYVTLDEIASMIQRGEELVVIDNRNQGNITQSTLTQIIFEKQKKSPHQVPLATLRYIISQGDGSFGAFLNKTEEHQMNIIKSLEDKVESLMARVDQLTQGFEQAPAALPTLEDSGVGSLSSQAQNNLVLGEEQNN